jgi:hypothetical protein
MLFRIKEEGLPFILFETRRDEKRQEKLLANGRSKAGFGDSPHNFGLAMDLVLDTTAIDVRNRDWRGRSYPDAWDNETPAAVDSWVRLGEIAGEIGLVWGGDWTRGGSQKSKRSNGESVLLGWDLPHIELDEWRRHRYG